MSTMHERMIRFFAKGGHTHDGTNSTVVDLQPGQVSLKHLDQGIINWILSLLQSTGAAGSVVTTAPDLEWITGSIAAGGVLTGSIDWINAGYVRFIRIVMSVDTTCHLTIYHKNTYASEDKEFRVENATNHFLSELVWAHVDEQDLSKIYWKIENTGTQAAAFKVQLKGTKIS